MDLKFYRITKEGLPIIFVFGLAGWIAALSDFQNISFLILLTTAFNIFFFRDPERVLVDEPDAFISPADGKIMSISDVREEKYLNIDTKRISIFLSILDCHINRFPITGKVVGTEYVKGKFNLAYKGSASNENERLITCIENGNGLKIVMVQIAGLVARRIISYANLNSEFKQGEKFGLIKYGSRMDVYIPADSKLYVEVGQKVRAGESVLAWMN